MKTRIHILYILSLFSIALFSCEKDEERVTVQQGAAPTLSSTTRALVLEKSKAKEDAITFSWNHLGLTFSDLEAASTKSVMYTLFFNKKGYPTDSTKRLEIGSLLEKKYTVSALNSLVINQFHMQPLVSEEVDFWIGARLAPNVDAVKSNILAITITPYAAEPPPLPVLYMVGNATEGGWDNTKSPRMFNSDTNPNVFVYTGFLKAGSVKFLEKLGAWIPQYGSDGHGGVASRPDETVADPASFTISADGYYSIAFDFPAKTVSIQPFDITGKPTFTSIGIIGSFGSPNWANIEPMTKSNFNPHIWLKDYTFNESVEVKFRIAENWDFNWGATSEATQSLLYGKGAQNSPNIKLDEGKYSIMFNDLTGNYVFIRK